MTGGALETPEGSTGIGGKGVKGSVKVRFCQEGAFEPPLQPHHVLCTNTTAR